jgi:uncharacterized protein (DUF927 family)
MMGTHLISKLINEAPLIKRTHWPVDGGYFSKKDGRIWFQPRPKGKKDIPPALNVCAELKVVSTTRDSTDCNYGYLVEWKTLSGKLRQRTIPAEMLQDNDGSELRKTLANAGFEISTDPHARRHLPAFIQAAAPKDCFALCTNRLGWHDGIYITPDGHIGDSNETTVFQRTGYVECALSQKGSPEAWIREVAGLASGNSRMVFAICCAFAAPLMHLCGEDSGGFHLVGASSSGKTTALHLASSVYGRPSEYTRTWRATANGLEGIAALHNDGLLVLDELSQVDPKQAGDVAYMLGNGQGKTRANQYGDARKAAKWRLLFLSSGEEGLESVMTSTGQRMKAGQSVRLVEIDADAGASMGAVQELHGHPSPAKLTLAMKEAAEKYHGAIGRKWLGYVVNNRAELVDAIPEAMETILEGWSCDKACSQVYRVAKRFALVAVSGELACVAGMTGWTSQQVNAAVKACFISWKQSFGEGNREEDEIVENMDSFFIQYGDSRFEDCKAPPERRIMDRLGFKTTLSVNGTAFIEYYLPPRVFREYICTHYQVEVVSRILKGKGILQPDSSGKNSQSLKFSNQNKQRYYVLRFEQGSSETSSN